MGGFRCKYIYFDIGFFELMKKWWLLKKGGRGECWVILYLILFFRINFRGKSILYV